MTHSTTISLTPLAAALLITLIGGAVPAQSDPLRALQKALGSDTSESEKARAIDAVARAAQRGEISAKKAARTLASILSSPAGQELELEAPLVAGLARLDDATAVGAILERSYASTRGTVRATAWRGLTRNPGREVEPVLVKALRSRGWEMRASAALVLCERGAHGALDELIDALDGEKRLAVCAALGEALERLTLKVLPVTHEAWKAWRKGNPEWAPRELPTAGGGVEGGGAQPAPDPDETVVTPPGPQKPRAYGIVPRFEHFPVEGEVVLLVVDVSTSMVKDGARALEDARTLIEALPSHVETMLLCFHETLMYADETFAPASVARKRELLDFLAAQRKKGGGTDLGVALLAALDKAEGWFESHPRDPRELDLIVFSDGESTATDRVTRVSADRVISTLTKLTSKHVIRFSTVASTGEATPAMTRLAEISGGYLVLGDLPDRGGLLR